jgi:hypothetical protein
MAIRIKKVSTREDVRLAIQNAVRQQVQTFDALSNVEHELGFDLINLESVVSTAPSDANGEYELSEEDFRNMLRELEREQAGRHGTVSRIYARAAGEKSSMKIDKKVAVQLDSSEFELILAALYSLQNHNRVRDTISIRNDWPDYVQGIDPIAPDAIQHIIARINCSPEPHTPSPKSKKEVL